MILALTLLEGFMHPSCVFFLEDVAKRFFRHFRNARVLEIGSCEINASMQSTVRPFFSNCDYVGVDKQPGTFVDVVSDINDCDFPENSFDTIVVLSVFEHDPTWRKTLANCIKWMKNGGICIASFGVEGNPFHLPEPWKPVPHKEFLAELVNYPVCLVVGLFEEDWYCYGTEAFSCVLRKGMLRPDIWDRSPGRYEWQGTWVPNPVHEPENPMPVAKCYRVPSQDIINRGGTK